MNMSVDASVGANRNLGGTCSLQMAHCHAKSVVQVGAIGFTQAVALAMVRTSYITVMGA